jgi:hypothetical protein
VLLPLNDRSQFLWRLQEHCSIRRLHLHRGGNYRGGNCSIAFAGGGYNYTT